MRRKKVGWAFAVSICTDMGIAKPYPIIAMEFRIKGSLRLDLQILRCDSQVRCLLEVVEGCLVRPARVTERPDVCTTINYFR